MTPRSIPCALALQAVRRFANDSIALDAREVAGFEETLP
jgi:hypothetical protein